MLLLAVTCSCNNVKNKKKIGAQLNTDSYLCHGKNSPWFLRMKYFRNYETMQECLKHGIREAYR
jgi:hypothetical protein